MLIRRSTHFWGLAVKVFGKVLANHYGATKKVLRKNPQDFFLEKTLQQRATTRVRPYFFIFVFASMLSVACGTARRRALSISLPVTRQMP